MRGACIVRLQNSRDFLQGFVRDYKFVEIFCTDLVKTLDTPPSVG